jgi:FAD/FMN-containing dehydrogenase
MNAPIEIATLDGGEVTLSGEELRAFAATVDGPLLRPGDPGWDGAVEVWNGMIPKVPALALQPTSARDIAAAVSFARDRRLSLSVKGGGHNVAVTSIADGGLVLDLSRMRRVDVSPAERLARVSGGCLLQDVDRATQAHGLATVLGFMSEVGVGGLTLGGGLGYLTRRFGWTVDNLEEVEIVTADGAIRTANREENGDLFWAIRGGGGNFGVVTRFTFRLHEVGPMVHGGLIGWPFERAAEILPAYRRMTREAPPELSAWLIFIRAPAAPFVPEAWHGKRVCAMAVCYTGDLAHTASALAPIRAMGEPVFDLLRDQPYVEIQALLDASEPKGHHYYWRTEFADDLSDELLATWRALAADCPIPEAQLGILHLGGSLNRHPWDEGAVGNRDARYALGAIGAWEPDELEAARFRAWIRGAWERFRPYSTGGNYINFQAADEGDERIRASYRGNLDRLLAIKRRYDPLNLFRSNRNLGAPAG